MRMGLLEQIAACVAHASSGETVLFVTATEGLATRARELLAAHPDAEAAKRVTVRTPTGEYLGSLLHLVEIDGDR